MLEANAKVNERGQISHPHPTKTPEPIWMAIQIYHYVRPGSGCAKFGAFGFCRYESAHARKNAFSCGFFLLTYPSIYFYPFFVGATGHIFGTTLTRNGLNDVFSHPLVPFGGLDDTL